MKRLALVPIAAGGLLLATTATPHVLRQLDAFRVRQVEIRGTKYLQPRDALRASGITSESSVFDDFAVWRTTLEKHPLIARVRIERQLPGKIRLLITEAQPVALISAPELRVVTGEGVLLPVDPTNVDLDLPVLLRRVKEDQGRVRDAQVLKALAVVAHVHTAEPALFGWISDVEPVRTSVRVRLRAPAEIEVWLSDAPDPAQLRKLRLTLADLTARRELGRTIRIDARFRDQIVVTLTPTAAS